MPFFIFAQINFRFEMKKNIVLFILFILPIVAYLFFASGVNSFTKLPIVTPKMADFGKWKTLKDEPVSLNGKITILGFGGLDILKNRGNYFNLNQKIYQRYHEFKDLQFVVLCPIGTEADAQKIVTSLSGFTDVSQWHFVFTTPENIKAYYDQMKVNRPLNADFGTANVFIVDKERNLRGRKGDTKFEAGYSTFHPSELSNEMLDDFKIILYEYRSAFKRNNADRQI